MIQKRLPTEKVKAQMDSQPNPTRPFKGDLQPVLLKLSKERRKLRKRNREGHLQILLQSQFHALTKTGKDTT